MTRWPSEGVFVYMSNLCCALLIIDLTGLNYYDLLKSFFNLICVCVRNVILHHFRYKEFGLNYFNLCFRTI